VLHRSVLFCALEEEARCIPPRTSTVGYGTWLRTIDDDLQYLNFGVRGTPHGLEVGKT